jgi:hypothetical protein
MARNDSKKLLLRGERGNERLGLGLAWDFDAIDRNPSPDPRDRVRDGIRICYDSIYYGTSKPLRLHHDQVLLCYTSAHLAPGSLDVVVCIG